MTVLNESQLAELRRDLETLERELSALLEMSQEGARPVSLETPIGRLSRMDALQNQQMAKANLEAHTVRLNLVREALEAMTDGDYGDCILCERPIPFTRLKGLPETPLCLQCQEGRERNR